MNIIARKPKDVRNETIESEYIVVDRGADVTHRFVSATANAHSLKNGEWFWGSYFTTRDEAMAHFNSREESLMAMLYRCRQEGRT